MHKRLFYDWVHPKLDLALLILMTLCIGATSGVSTSISTYMVAGFTSNPADASMCSYAYLAGMAVGFIPVNKLSGYFSSKHLLIAICSALLLLNYILTATDSVPIIAISTFLIGAIRLTGSIMMLVRLFPILMPNGSQRFQLYCVYYTLSLMVSPLTGIGMVWMSDKIGWHYSFHFCNLLLFVVLLITITMVRGGFQGRKLPLWKYDWFSLFLISGWMLSFTYIIVYGRNLEWFESYQIRYATIVTLVIVLILLLRNAMLKSPILHFSILRHRNVRVGLIMLFLLCMFYAVTGPLTTWTTLAFHNNPIENASINAYPVYGYILGAIICYIYFKRSVKIKEILICAAICYEVSSIMIYFSIDAQVEATRLFIPMVLRGMGIIISYITIGLYVVTGITGAALSIIPVFLIFLRSFLGPTIWGGFYASWIYYRQIQLTDKLASWSDATDPIFQDRFTSGQHNINVIQAYQTFRLQAQLGTLKELFGWICIIGIGIIIWLIFLPIYKDVDRTIFNWKKRKNTEDIASAIAG